MTGDGLFHIDGNDDLVAMVATPYAAEDVLQTLLESHADLLAGGQMTPHDPRRWALVRREQSVPDSVDSTGRWSIDHLFVDQDAVPTLVEVKRSSDTRIRREVVGQMLDYAANGVRYWPIERLQAAFETTQLDRGRDPRSAIEELTRDAMSLEEFFDAVGDNLRSGRIRMVFVADVIPDELQRITEFLNEQMSPAEVFAVEVRQYQATGYPGRVIVPTVYGRTAAAIVKSPARSRVSREEALSRSTESTRAVLTLLAELHRVIPIVLREAPAGLIVETESRQTIANVYLAPYDSVDVALKPIRESGHDADANAILVRLQQMTTKRLTAQYPAMPSDDVVAHWAAITEVLTDMVGFIS